MIDINIPGFGHVRVHHLVLDMNGTIATGGVIHESLREPLAVVKDSLDIHVVSADNYGTLAAMASSFGLQAHVLPRVASEREEKLAFIQQLDPGRVVAMGNGGNDALMLQAARIGICVIGEEGAAREAIMAADIIVTRPQDAFALLTEPRRMVATLRR